MLAYGYPRNSESDYPEQLQEASLLCTKEELDRIIEFLQNLQSKSSSFESVTGIHAHFRDYDKCWNASSSDFIICLRDEET